MGAELIQGQHLVDTFLSLLSPASTANQIPTMQMGAETAPKGIVNSLCATVQRKELDHWKGDWQSCGKYPSQSEADMALAGAIARAAVQRNVPNDMLIDAAMQCFMQSGLYRPEKHKQLANYTIPKAIASALESRNQQGQGDTHAKSILLSGHIKIPTTPPAGRDYVAIGMVMGMPYVLTSFGGVGKTQLSIQLACSVASGVTLLAEKVTQGCVLSIHSEDDTGEIHRRAGAWAVHVKFDAATRAAIEKHWRAHGLVREDTRLTVKYERVLQQTSFVQDVIGAAQKLAEDTGIPTRLIILDHAALMHGGDFNDKTDVALFMRLVSLVAVETGAAVLLLAHSPKNVANAEESDAMAISGSTAFVDMARGAFVLATMRKNEAKEYGYTDDARHGYASLATVKNNLGPSSKAVWFARTSVPGWEVGILDPVILTKPTKQVKGGATTQRFILDYIITHPGQHSKTHLRDSYAGKDGIFKASKGAVDVAIEELIGIKQIILRPPTDEERKKFGLHSRVKMVMEAKS